MLYYRMDASSGIHEVDASGNGNDGTYNGTVTFGQTGAIAKDNDQAVLFDGASAYIIAPTLGSQPNAYECWFKPARTLNAGGPGLGVIVSGGDPAGRAYSYAGPDTGGEDSPLLDVVCGNIPTGFRYWSNPGGTITTDWHHYVIRWTGSTWQIWFDGVQVDNQSYNGDIVAWTVKTPLFGALEDSGSIVDFFNGSFDECAVYADLPPDRIVAHYNAGIGNYSPITFVAGTQFVSPSAVSTLTLTRPTDVMAGDLLIFVVLVLDGSIVNVPNDLTLLRSDGGMRPNSYIYTKSATSSDPSTWTFTLSTIWWNMGFVLAYRNASRIGNAAGQETTDTSITAPSVVAPQNSLVLCVFASGGNGNSDIALPSMINRRSSPAANSFLDAAVADFTNVSTGPTASQVATTSVSQGTVGQQIVLLQ